MGRALRASSVRYTLTDEPDEARWRSLRIKPIRYPVVNGSHEALVDAISGWASQASMGLLDHRQRIGDLVTAAPSSVPEEVSYLESVVAEPGKVKFFVEFARGAEWLDWVATRAEFRALFGSADQDSICTRELAWWFAYHFVTDEDRSPTALDVMLRSGGRVGPALWWAIGQALHVLDGSRPAWLAPWLVLLIRDRPESAGDWLDYALVKSSWPEDRASALLLFDHLTEPLPELSRTFGGSVPTRMDVTVRGDAHWLKDAWTAVFAPHIEEAEEDLVGMAERHLRRARHILVAAGAADARWDPTSFRRSAIEPHSQDQHAANDILIDVARDCLEALLAAGSPSATALLDRWTDADVPLGSEPPSTDVDDWLTLAINRPAGQLAEFWLHAVAGDWRAAGDSWQALTAEHRAALDEMLGGADARTAYAEVVLASQLGFFYAADPGWTTERLLPLLDWADPARARRAWEGFLSWGAPPWHCSRQDCWSVTSRPSGTSKRSGTSTESC